METLQGARLRASRPNAPNLAWCADHNGEFRLAVTDSYVLARESLASTKETGAFSVPA